MWTLLSKEETMGETCQGCFELDREVKRLQLQVGELQKLLKLARVGHCYHNCPANTEKWGHEPKCQQMEAALTEKR
jgi:hypothetical protein